MGNSRDISQSPVDFTRAHPADFFSHSLCALVVRLRTPFILMTLSFLVLIPLTETLADEDLSLQESMSIWREIQSLSSASSSTTSSVVLPSACECPLLDPTTDNCPPHNRKRICERNGCAKVRITSKGAYVESAHCGHGTLKGCKCDPNTITPPLAQGWTTRCERANSISCGDFKCLLYDDTGHFHSRSTVSCGTR